MTALFINHTPHPVTILAEDGSVVVTFPQSGAVPRISELVDATGDVAGVPIEYVEYGEPTGLPEASPGVHLIVSRVLAFALPHRDDLCFPSREVRDDTGRIIGCRALGYVDLARVAMTADLRAAIEAALPDLTDDQAQAARALLDTLTPPMDEPTWPGAPVIAACGGARRRLHVRRNDGVRFGWECASYCTGTSWDQLVNPRPLTPAEYAEHGIPEPCEHVADGGTVERATRAFREHQGDVPESMRAGLIAAGFKAADQ